MTSSFRDRRVVIAGFLMAGAAIALGVHLLAPTSATAENLFARARLWIDRAAPEPDWATLPRGPVLQHAAQRGALLVAVRAYPRPAPPGSPSPAEPDNYDTALAHYIADTLGLPVQITQLPSPDQVLDQAGAQALSQADLVIGGSLYGIPVAGDRASSSPDQSVATAYTPGHAMLVALRAVTWDRPAGHSVCLQQGSPYAAELADAYGARPIAYASSVHAAYAFMSGDCDLFAEDDAVLQRLMAREDWRFYKPLPVDIQTRLKSQIRLSRADAVSAQYLDNVVRQWRASGAQQKARELRAGEINLEVAMLRDGLVCHG